MLLIVCGVEAVLLLKFNAEAAAKDVAFKEMLESNEHERGVTAKTITELQQASEK